MAYTLADLTFDVFGNYFYYYCRRVAIGPIPYSASRVRFRMLSEDIGDNSKILSVRSVCIGIADDTAYYPNLYDLTKPIVQCTSGGEEYFNVNVRPSGTVTDWVNINISAGDTILIQFYEAASLNGGGQETYRRYYSGDSVHDGFNKVGTWYSYGTYDQLLGDNNNWGNNLNWYQHASYPFVVDLIEGMRGPFSVVQPIYTADIHAKQAIHTADIHFNQSFGPAYIFRKHRVEPFGLLIGKQYNEPFQYNGLSYQNKQYFGILLSNSLGYQSLHSLVETSTRQSFQYHNPFSVRQAISGTTSISPKRFRQIFSIKNTYTIQNINIGQLFGIVQTSSFLQDVDETDTLSPIMLRQNIRDYESNYIHFNQPFSIYESIANKQYRQLFSLVDYNKVASHFNQVFDLRDSTEIVDNNTEVLHNGVAIDVFSFDISISQGDFYWSFNATLDDVDVYNNINIGDSISVEINNGAVTFNFIVDGKTKTQSVSSLNLNVSGLSNSSLFGGVWHKSINYINNTDTTFHTVAIELLGNSNIVFDLDDYFIKAGTLSVEDKTPIQIVSLLAEVRGGFLQSLPDGRVLVRHKYSDTALLHEYTTTDDVFSLTEKPVQAEGYNKVTIISESGVSNYSCMLVDKPISSVLHEIEVYEEPFNSVPALKSNNVPGSSLWYKDTVTEKVSETVTIIDGLGNISFASFGVINYSWIGDNLGNITVTGTDVVSSVVGNSLLSITYNKKYHRFVATGDYNTSLLVYKEAD